VKKKAKESVYGGGEGNKTFRNGAGGNCPNVMEKVLGDVCGKAKENGTEGGTKEHEKLKFKKTGVWVFGL